MNDEPARPGQHLRLRHLRPLGARPARPRRRRAGARLVAAARPALLVRSPASVPARTVPGRPRLWDVAKAQELAGRRTSRIATRSPRTRRLVRRQGAQQVRVAVAATTAHLRLMGRRRRACAEVATPAPTDRRPPRGAGSPADGALRNRQGEPENLVAAEWQAHGEDARAAPEQDGHSLLRVGLVPARAASPTSRAVVVRQTAAGRALLPALPRPGWATLRRGAGGVVLWKGATYQPVVSHRPCVGHTRGGWRTRHTILIYPVKVSGEGRSPQVLRQRGSDLRSGRLR